MRSTPGSYVFIYPTARSLSMFFDRRRAWAVSYWLICIVLHDDTRVKRLVWVFIVCIEIVGEISLVLTGYSGCSSC